MIRRALWPPSRVKSSAPAASRSKAHVEFVEQQLLHRARAFAHEMLDRHGIRRAIAGLEDVARQRGGIVRRVVDDPALRPVAVGRERLGERKQFDGEAELRGVQRIGRAGEAGADDEAVGAKDLHAINGVAARDGLDVEAQIDRGRRMRQRADADHVHPGQRETRATFRTARRPKPRPPRRRR